MGLRHFTCARRKDRAQLLLQDTLNCYLVCETLGPNPLRILNISSSGARLDVRESPYWLIPGQILSGTLLIGPLFLSSVRFRCVWMTEGLAGIELIEAESWFEDFVEEQFRFELLGARMRPLPATMSTFSKETDLRFKSPEGDVFEIFTHHGKLNSLHADFPTLNVAAKGSKKNQNLYLIPKTVTAPGKLHSLLLDFQKIIHNIQGITPQLKFEVLELAQLVAE